MDLINKWWKRLLISLIFGGMLSEGISLITNRKLEINAFIWGIILYLILSIIFGILQKK